LTVPSCDPCNKRLKRAEDAIGLDLVLICQTDLPEITGVPEKIFRAWNAAHARDAKDAGHRAGKGRRILRTMEWPDAVVGAPHVLVEKNGIIRAASPARKIDHKAFEAVVEKFVRGLHYLEAKAIMKEPGAAPNVNPLLPTDLVFRSQMLPNATMRAATPVLTIGDFPPELVEGIRKQPIFTMFGPGFVYSRIWTPQRASTWVFRLWGQLEIFAIVFPSALAAQLDKAAGRSR
jgi:hypothetical protein